MLYSDNVRLIEDLLIAVMTLEPYVKDFLLAPKIGSICPTAEDVICRARSKMAREMDGCRFLRRFFC